jgi:hypothetical protein
MAKKETNRNKSSRKPPETPAPKAVRKIAKKAAKKAARKTSAKVAKKVAKKTAKKVARKALAAKPKAPEAQAGPSTPAVSDLATLAYQIYLERLEKDLPGDELSDWAAAERSLQAA